VRACTAGAAHLSHTSKAKEAGRRPPANEYLNNLIAERHQRTATVVTSKLDFTQGD